MTKEQEHNAKIAREKGWTDVRLCRMIGRGLVLRGFKPFVTCAGRISSTQEDVPNFNKPT